MGQFDQLLANIAAATQNARGSLGNRSGGDPAINQYQSEMNSGYGRTSAIGAPGGIDTGSYSGTGTIGTKPEIALPSKGGNGLGIGNEFNNGAGTAYGGDSGGGGGTLQWLVQQLMGSGKPMSSL